MTTISVDSRTFRLRIPVLRLGRLRGGLVLHVTERIEVRVERHRARPVRRSAALGAAAVAAERAEAHRTAAMAYRLPAL